LVTVIFRAKMKAGKEDQAIDAMKKMAAAVESAEGDTLVYAICRNQEDPSELLVLESYKDDAAFQAHMATSHMGDMRAAFGDLFEPSGVKLERIERLAGFARG
jgi:quinol monooxygenase YgiN